MKSIAYIQADDDGHPYIPNGAVAKKGFEALGYDVRLFRRNELADMTLTPQTVVVGGVGSVRAALEQAGGRVPFYAGVPAVLEPFLGRKSWRTTVPELYQSDFPVFVKPYEAEKMFNGQVVASADALKRLLLPRDGFPPVTEDLLLLAQEPVDFVSEWRAFVTHGRVVGLSHYAGDALTLPNPSIIRRCVGAYVGAPAGYSADFGIDEKGRTLLVETNDGYSLGHGGLVAASYASLLRARWEELVG